MLAERLFQILFWSALVFAFVMASLPQPPALPGDPGDKRKRCPGPTLRG